MNEIRRRQDTVVVIVDAANLSRNLVLVGQLLAAHTRLIVCLNMTDVAARRGLTVDADALGARLGVTVVRWWLRAGMAWTPCVAQLAERSGPRPEPCRAPRTCPLLARHIGR